MPKHRQYFVKITYIPQSLASKGNTLYLQNNEELTATDNSGPDCLFTLQEIKDNLQFFFNPLTPDVEYITIIPLK